MFSSTNNKIIVSCDLYQKDKIIIDGIEFRMANNYESNYRLKSPVICTVEEGNELIQAGDILVCHHNLFYQPSPYFIYNKKYESTNRVVFIDYFSVPFSKVLFAKILQDGELLPICGNIIGDKIPKKYDLPVAPDAREMYNDRMVVTNGGYTKFNKGDIIFARPSSCYDIVYHFNSEQKVSTKISEDMICGIMKIN